MISNRLSLPLLGVSASLFLAPLAAAQPCSAPGNKCSALWGECGESWTDSSRLPDFSYAGYHCGGALPEFCVTGKECPSGPTGIGLDPNADAGERCDPDAPVVSLKVGLIDVTTGEELAVPAIPGDGLDDGPAFQQAIDLAGAELDGDPNLDYVIVHAPAGVYRIDQVLKLQRDRVVLRGVDPSEGPGETVLQFPPIREADGHRFPPSGNCELPPGFAGCQAPAGQCCSYDFDFCDCSYSSFGALIVLGEDRAVRPSPRVLGQVLGPDFGDRYPRGSRRFDVEASPGARVEVGDWVVLEQRDPLAPAAGECEEPESLVRPGAFARNVYGGELCGGEELHGATLMRLPSRVTNVLKDPLRIELERPVRLPVAPGWRPLLTSFDPRVEEVGVEYLTIEFSQSDAYAGHLIEPGANGLWLADVAHPWVREVRIENSDSGVAFSNSRFATVRGVTLSGTRMPRVWEEQGICSGDDDVLLPISGHHGFSVRSLSSDNLIDDFHVDGIRYCHDISLATAANGNVFSNGSGFDTNIDHESGAIHENLFSNLDVGLGTRLWASSNVGEPVQAGARHTYWNVDGRGLAGRIEFELPPTYPRLAPGVWGGSGSNFVGFFSRISDPIDLRSEFGPWLEYVTGGDVIYPPELRAAQYSRRTSGPPSSCSPGGPVFPWLEWPDDRLLDCSDGACSD